MLSLQRFGVEWSSSHRARRLLEAEVRDVRKSPRAFC